MSEKDAREHAARLEKANHLASWIEAVWRNLGPAVDTESLIEGLIAMTPQWWAEVAEQAGTREPSEKTIEVVQGILRDRAEVRAKVLVPELKGCDV